MCGYVQGDSKVMRHRTAALLMQLPKKLYTMGGSPGDVSENPVTYERQKKGWRMSCDVGEAMEGLENEL